MSFWTEAFAHSVVTPAQKNRCWWSLRRSLVAAASAVGAMLQHYLQIFGLNAHTPLYTLNSRFLNPNIPKPKPLTP